MKDRLGLAFFTFAAVVSALAAWEQPTVLAWLAAWHNAILAASTHAVSRRRVTINVALCWGFWLLCCRWLLPIQPRCLCRS
ncbi:MAG: hypothetical protein KatS3mg045_0944 [Bellilinea sp.]|nr:MAG: hypothetical protein KatS3mg045_0944 [Bellilinea sp.]